MKLAFQFFKESYSGAVREITLGKGDKAVKVGGETCYPFYQFEGEMPNKPKIAMEVWDMKPEDWPESAIKPFEDVIGDPAAWAKKCVEEYGADMIALLLRSTDPNDKDASPEDAVKTVKKVLDAVNVPLIVWGTAAPQKDEAVLKKIAEECQGANLILGPVEDKNHKGIGAAAMGFGHTVISSSPIDVNLAKQVNILLENLGMPMDRVIVDPTTGGLGYGLEYSYSVMERLRMAAMAQGDEKLQYPMMNNVGYEVWKSKEAKLPAGDDPTLGDPERRAIMMEAVAAVSYLVSGSDLLIIRHPETVRLVKSYIDLAVDGGKVGDVAAIQKKLPASEIDLVKLSPEPDLTIEEEVKKAAPAPKAPPKAAEKPKEAPKAAAPKPAEAKPEPAIEAKAAEDAKKAAEEAKAQAAAKSAEQAAEDAKRQADAEARKKAEAEAKAKADAEAREKAEKEAKAKADADAKAKRDAEENEVRQKRAKEREERLSQLAADRAKRLGEEAEMTAADIQKSALDRLVERIDWVNGRK
jgi:acetyl-CoA decarbonylase/synthase, CODH/ACS complex subunit delta